MADKRISQLIERVDIENNDVLPIVASGATTTNKVTISSIQTFMQGNLDLGVTSVGLSMPSAFSVTNSPVTGTGNISVTGAGTTAQYIRGDGSLADFPSASGGGSSVSYYLNGSVSQGTIGGVAYQELSKVPILGSGTDFTIAADGYIASFITDIFEPKLLEIPGGNWNFETYFQASSGGGSPTFYVELYKVSYPTGTATLIASNSATPELIAFGTNITPYFSTLAVPTTALALTDRLALRYYVTHSGRTITMHTENNTLCQIITTFSTGLTALNGLTAQVQNFATGTNGTDFNIESASTTHVFNLPTASGTNRGALSSTDWSTFNSKVGGTGASGQVAFWNGTSSQAGDNGLFWDNTNKRLGIGTNTPNAPFQITGSTTAASAIARGANLTSTLVAAANNDVLVGLDVNPTFTNGAFTGVQNLALRVGTSSNVPFGLPLIFIGKDENTNVNFTISNSTSGTSANAGINILGANGRTSTIAEYSALHSNPEFASNLVIEPNSPGVKHGLVISIPETVSGSNLVVYTAGRAATNKKLTLFNSTGNLLLQSGGTHTDAGFRLDVNGTARVQGVLTTTADASVNGVSVGLGGGAISSNTRVGNASILNNSTGSSNTAIGLGALRNNTTGSSNVAIGSSAGRNIADNVTSNTISASSIYIGASARALADNQSNQIVIGDQSVGLGSNTTVIGNSSTTFGRWFGNLLVGTSTNAGFALDVNGTARVQGRITNVAPSITNTREILYRGSVSDNANDAFIIANGTSADSVFAPNFVGFNQSSQLLWGLGFTGLLTSTNDASDSSVFGVIRFNAARTDNSADPINGAFTSIANRKLFTFENNAVPVGTVFRTGNWLIQNGGTATDVASAILNVNSTTQGFLPPRMTTTQRNAIASPATGLVLFDTTLNKLAVYTGAAWETITSV